MHTEAISNPIWALAKRLHSISGMNDAYLGGGTGLALQIGHRREEANQESDPLFIWDINWEDVKLSLTKEVRKIAEKI
jgi:hypothetical protein